MPEIRIDYAEIVLFAAGLGIGLGFLFGVYALGAWL